MSGTAVYSTQLQGRINDQTTKYRMKGILWRPTHKVMNPHHAKNPLIKQAPIEVC